MYLENHFKVKSHIEKLVIHHRSLYHYHGKGRKGGKGFCHRVGDTSVTSNPTEKITVEVLPNIGKILFQTHTVEKKR